ncbi:19309_t:CDS:2 [Cetraspora pellucida]|uniref:19309_t:CDS:1 n=1 Tax=Cetraspora pellucida TaxID=1433469 RepID=A0A9N9CQM6_9GLOM|nr:19309_t:CDS:2 [Cetraspora pellucida]
MSAITSLQSQQTQQKQGFRKIMTFNSRKSNKKHSSLFYDSAPEGGEDSQTTPAPASPTQSVRSLSHKSGRPSFFAAFARRNSTKSEHSSRSRSPTSPRPSNDYNLTPEDLRTPSPTPSRHSIFERDIENHDRLSVHEAIDLAIPSALDNVAEAFVNEEIPIPVEDGTDSIVNNGNGSDGHGLWINTRGEIDGRKRLSLININRTPSPGPYDQKNTIADTLRVTTPREMNALTGIFDNSWK